MTNPQPDKAVPTTQTFYRLVGLRQDYDKTLQSVYRIADAQPSGEEGLAFRRIIEATNPADVVRMTTLSRGVAQLAWTQRMNEFGAAALPHIVRRLKSSQSIFNPDERHIVTERLIGALRRMGAMGGQALFECFNNLDAYGQSLACVALGILKTEPAIEPVWRFYQRVKTDADTGLIVGALWGLIGLRDERVDEIMADLMKAGRIYAEQIPFAALAGGESTLRALAHRLSVAVAKDHHKDERDDILMAIAAIGHRLGMERLRSVLDDCVEPAATVQSIIDIVERTPPERVATYFKMYFTEPA
ncbi:MAG TPA: hypothetical protein VGK87_04055 [Anaerolineae bacterium]|jgi:hypothetical protein